ncbi:MAG: carboxypeptidase regulatory-like domain-containing protein [Acidobacteriota bacterium]|nr:MAG: carboxypeptidase regulatory-like domain-containing protein [Acidobacteriota bacterium]
MKLKKNRVLVGIVAIGIVIASVCVESGLGISRLISAIESMVTPVVSGAGMRDDEVADVEPKLGVDHLATADCVAGQKTWDGEGATNNWSEAANWTCDQVPTNTNLVIFDATSTKNAFIDMNINVNRWQINAGYTGTITQGPASSVLVRFNSNAPFFIQSAGNFVCSSAPVTFEYSIVTISGGTFDCSATTSMIVRATSQAFDLSGGSFTAPAGTLSFNGGVVNIASASFIDSNGTVAFRGDDGTGGSGSSVDLNIDGASAGQLVLNNLTIDSSATGGRLLLTDQDSLVANGTLSLLDGDFMMSNPNSTNGNTAIHAFGPVTVSPNWGNNTGTTTGNATIKLLGNATRTVDIPSGLTGTFNPLLVDAPNTTVNVNGSGLFSIGKLDLLQGVLNAGQAEFQFENALNTVSGGSFSCGTGPIKGIQTRIAVSGGSFDCSLAASMTLLASELAVTGGTFTAPATTLSFLGSRDSGLSVNTGTFRHNNGTVKFGRVFNTSPSFSSVSTFLDVDGSNAGTLDLFNVVLDDDDPNTGSTGSFSITSSDRLRVLSNLSLLKGRIGKGSGLFLNTFLDVFGNFTVGSGFSGGLGSNFVIGFKGSADQTFTNNGGWNPVVSSFSYVIDKPSGTVTAASPMELIALDGFSNPFAVDLTIQSGRLYLANGSDLKVQNLTVNSGGRLVSDSAATITLFGNVVNNGVIDLQGGGAACPETETILIRSNDTNQKNWSGSGIYRLVDVDVERMGGTGTKTVFSGTNSGNNNGTWIFNNDCPPPLTISPTSTSVTAGNTQTFTRSGGFGAATFNFVQNNSGGTINPTTGLYAAGFTDSVTDTLQLTDSLGEIANATVNITPPPPLVITPSQTFVQNGTSFDFDASGGIGPYTFSFQTNGSGGTINGSTGLYTAGPNVGTSDSIKVSDARGVEAFAVVSTYGQPAFLQFTSQPASTTAGAILSPMQVVVRDSGGNLVRNSSIAVTIEILVNPGNGVLSGVLTRNAVDGLLTFDGLSINKSGNNYVLRSSASGLTPANTVNFSISPGPANKLGFLSQPNDAEIGQQAIIPFVEVQDALGNRVPSGTRSITLAIGANPGGGALSGTTTKNTANGVASFPDISINKGGTGYTLMASTNSLTGTQSNSFNIIDQFQVTNTNDSGPGSLRQAIIRANLLTFDKTISFNIPGSGPHTIQPLTFLPPITKRVVIDATTQPGYSGTPVIELDGTFANNAGLAIQADDVTVRGFAINRFAGAAISVQNRNGVTIESNYIGTDITGSTAMPNGLEQIVLMQSRNVVIGGADASRRNLIAGGSTGIYVGRNSGQSFNIDATILGNYIGTNAAGTGPITTSIGISVAGNSAVNIGDGTPAGSNTIAFNTSAGVSVAGALTRVRIRRNSIFVNALKGIALAPGSTGPIPNDLLDEDSGPNGLQNYPDISSAIAGNGETTISGSLSSKPSTSYTVDLYSVTQCDSSGHGEGQTYLGSMQVATDAGGLGSVDLVLPVTVSAGDFVTATATDPLGNTSEFSRCEPVVAGVHSIAGRVLVGSVGVPGVELVVSGDASLSVRTNRLGNYEIRNLPAGGTYTVVPREGNFSFLPASRTYADLSANQIDQTFEPTRERYSIRGRVTTLNNGSEFALSDVTIATTGGPSPNTTAKTNLNGEFSIPKLMPGTYSVTPSAEGRTFSPASASVTISTDDRTADFSAFGYPSMPGKLIFATRNSVLMSNPSGSGITVARLPIYYGSGSAFIPDLSTDGHTIAAIYDNVTVRAAHVDGSNQRNVVYNNGNIKTGMNISPDGTRLALNAGGQTQVRNVNFSSESTFIVGAFQDSAWSANGSQLAFSRITDSELQRHLYLVQANGTGLDQLTGPGNFLDESPQWAPDNSKIAFVRFENSTSSSKLMLMNPNGTGQQAIYTGPTKLLSVDWSPDSSRLAITERSENGKVALSIIRRDGTEKLIVNPDFPNSRIRWGGDNSVATPEGSNVSVSTGSVSVSFANTSGTGATTTIDPILPGAAGAVPGGFAISQNGSVAEYGSFEISTTSTVTAPITVCIDLSPSTTQQQLNSLSFMHNEGGVLVDRTSSRIFTNTPFAVRKICATTTSLSPFALVEEIDPSKPSLSGSVVDNNGDPLADALIVLSGSETRDTFTDSDGSFTFHNLEEFGNYIVQPSLPGYIFREPDATFLNMSGENTVVFVGTAATVGISGKVTDLNGDPMADLLVSLEGGTSREATTDASGDYSFTDLPADSSYTVSPRPGFNTFAPQYIDLPRLRDAATDVDFTIDGGCQFSIDPTLQNYGSAGGDGAISVTASDSTCDWTAVSNDAWITVTSGSSGTGDGTVEYTVAANTGEARTGTITVAGETFTVTQAASCPTVSIPASGLAGAPGTSLTVPVNVTDLTGRGATAYDFTLTYDPAVLEFTGESIAGTLSSNYVVQVNEPIAGTLVVSGFGVDDLTGEGVLLNLQFDITATTSSCSTLHLAAFEFNEGTPCVVTEDGEACSENRRVTGLVTYGNSLTPPAVPNVTISGVGSPNVNTVTDADGLYELTGFGTGAYTLTPSKSGHTDAITAFDAAITARHVIGTVILNATQQTVADVSNNGTISSFDASQIARFAVGNPNTGTTGTWRFTPPSRNYATVNGHIAAQDHVALLMGEVSGNWAVAPPPEPLTEGVVPVAVSLANVSSGTSTTVSVPITTGDVTARGVISHQFEVSYDPAVAMPNAVPVEKTGTLSSELLVVSNTDMPGILRVAVYGTQDIVGEGTLLNLRFDVVGAPGTSTPLNFVDFMFNENDPQSAKTNGSITVLVPTAAGVEVSGRVMTPDGRGLRNATMTMTDTNGVVRSAVTSSFGYYRFEGVPVGESFVMSVNSRSYRFVPRVVQVLDTLTDVDFVGLE